MADSKTFSLKQAETQTLVVMQNSHQQAFAALLSMIAVERLGYHVTEKTQFKLNPELSEIEITEIVDVPTTKPDKPEEKSGAVEAK